jgi:hypothetical protein
VNCFDVRKLTSDRAERGVKPAICHPLEFWKKSKAKGNSVVYHILIMKINPLET